jgi:hypothetical protein
MASELRWQRLGMALGIGIALGAWLLLLGAVVAALL